MRTILCDLAQEITDCFPSIPHQRVNDMADLHSAKVSVCLSSTDEDDGLASDICHA